MSSGALPYSVMRNLGWPWRYFYRVIREDADGSWHTVSIYLSERKARARMDDKNGIKP